MYEEEHAVALEYNDKRDAALAKIEAMDPHPLDDVDDPTDIPDIVFEFMSFDQIVAEAAKRSK